MPLVSATQVPQQGSWWSGAPAQVITTQRYTPGQQQTADWARQFGQSQLAGNQFDFAPIEAQARAGFKEKTIPSIMERFASMGGEGTAGSSALQGALGSASSDLERGLAALKSQYNLQREPLLQQLLGMGMQQQYETSYQPRRAGAWESPLSTMLGGLGLTGVLAGGQAMFGGSGAGQTYRSDTQIDPVTKQEYTPYNQPGYRGASSGSGDGWATAGKTAVELIPTILKIAAMFA
jgi:hypothetical protein